MSSGNNPKLVTAPGTYPSAITVGALTDENEVAAFSGRGRSLAYEVKPEVVAPGTGITSTVPSGGWARKTGTSMATPHVAGVAALLLQARPDLTPQDIKDILKRTATPLSSQVPDPDSGWGVVNAYAAVASVTDVGYIRGHVLRFDGAVIPWARVHLAELNGDHLTTVQVDPADGSYEIAIRPGQYLVTVEAFTFVLETRRGVEVEQDRATELDIALVPDEPMGTLQGWVYGQQDGVRVPMGARVRLAEAPEGFDIESDEFTGFAQQLPPGTYHVRVEKFGYRVLTDTVKITAGYVTSRTYEPEPAPTILLVDGDAWMYNGAIDYYRGSLDRLGYVYDEWRVTVETALPGTPGGAPKAAELAPYDLVIWSSSTSSPGFVRGANELSAFLAGGGRLFLSGQDALCTDAGTDVANDPCNRRTGRHPYVQEQLRLRVVRDSANALALHGATGGLLEGLSLTLNGPDSMGNQFVPDVLAVTDPLAASLVAEYEGGGGAAVLTGTCLDYNAIAFGFGFEGIGGASNRDEVMDRVIAALAAPLPERGLQVWPEAMHIVTRVGATADYTTTLRSTGSETTDFAVAVEATRWDATAWRAGLTEPLTGPLRLGYCEAVPLVIRVQVPANARRGEGDTTTVRVRSAEGEAERGLTLQTSTAAPVLVVDGDFWQDSEDRYLDALAEVGVPYDVWEFGLLASAPKRPAIEDLTLYPSVVWFTGYDWRPNGSLSVGSQQALAEYLDNGGRLLFSSEDYLLIRGETPFEEDRLFRHEYLGVERYEQDLGGARPRILQGADRSIFEGISGCRLLPRNTEEDFADRLIPRATARNGLVDEFGQNLAVQYASGAFKSLFLAFDTWLLDQPCADELMRRSLDWFSPLHPSALRDPTERRTYAAGERVTLELELLNEGPRGVDGVQVRWKLPLEGELEEIPVGWSLRPEDRTLMWFGDLGRGRSKKTTIVFVLDANLPANSTLISAAEIDDGQGLTLQRQAELRVNAPDLRTSYKAVDDNWKDLSVGERARFSILIRNTGTQPANEFVVTDTLPSGLRLVPRGIQKDNGTVEADTTSGTIVWRGTVDADSNAALSYEARVVTYGGGWLRNIAVLTDEYGETITLSASVLARPYLLFPWLGKQIDQDP